MSCNTRSSSTLRSLMVLVGASAVAMTGCDRDRATRTGPVGLSIESNDVWECPGDSVLIREGDNAITHISLAGATTNVLGFHDCQRLVRGDAYDSLYAIFASARLPHLTRDLDSLRNQGATLPGVPVAVIYSKGGMYAPLGIEPGFNCVYVSHSDDDWRAKMVPLGEREASCLHPIASTAAAPGKDLLVHRLSSTGAADADYPPVTRWDWDAANLEHFIGVKCGAAWCEIGDNGFQGSTVGKGWHDEQRLAIPASGGAMRPSVRAALFPAAGLGQLSGFERQWVQVATAVLETSSPEYRTKMNFTQGANRIFLCSGSADGCQVPAPRPTCRSASDSAWWARIVSADGDAYRCVKHRDHGDLDVVMPGTARWRWQATDETVWVRCAQGCCEVH